MLDGSERSSGGLTLSHFPTHSGISTATTRYLSSVVRWQFHVLLIHFVMLKLIRWKIVVHGGVDGKTRVVVYLHASNNNRADTVRNIFCDATVEFGWPSRVRADWEGENLGVKEEMEAARGEGRGSFFAGPSTHNQRIERE